MSENDNWIRGLETLSTEDLGLVGGKNSALGELIRELSSAGIAVPGGFAVTAAAYRAFLANSKLEVLVADLEANLDVSAVADLQRRATTVREAIEAAPWPPELETSIRSAYLQLCEQAGTELSVAVRSSATAEDLPTASFAGQQDTYLHIRGADAVVDATRRCFASLFTARAVAYRENRGFGHSGVALSVGIQRMVRTDLGTSGVIFTLDPDSGHRSFVYVTAAYGLGEYVVQGKVVPDGYLVHKGTLAKGFPSIIDRRLGTKEQALRWDSGTGELKDVPVPPAEQAAWALTDEDVLQLSRWAVVIEDHFTERRGQPTPMDLEWGKDGETNELFILQARPETVQANASANTMRSFTIHPGDHEVVLTGLAVGDGVATGAVHIVEGTDHLADVQPGDVIVARSTDPDWEPVMELAAALVTEQGGRTSHAAIVARETGIPAVVAAAGALTLLTDGDTITVSCAEGAEGKVYRGAVPFDVDELDLSHLPKTRTRILVNLADPDHALKVSLLPVQGVGLVRMEFVFTNIIGVHPLALLHPDRLSPEVAARVAEHIGEVDPVDYFVDRLSMGLAKLAAAFHPRPVIVRFSDFKSNEYAHLLGGEGFEPKEENPMLGWRGASRYYDPAFKDAFALEVQAMRRVREVLGFDNAHVMIPFCRTPEEAVAVHAELVRGGLTRGEGGLEVYMMAEIPSNVLLAREFAKHFDGFSIGSNDLTQLVYGVDRDSAGVAHLFDDTGPALKEACRMLLESAHATHTKVGICGQAPSDNPAFAAFLVEHGIDSISVTPDAVVKVIRAVAAAEGKAST